MLHHLFNALFIAINLSLDCQNLFSHFGMSFLFSFRFSTYQVSEISLDVCFTIIHCSLTPWD